MSFEEYILSLLSSVAYIGHHDNHPNPYLSRHSGGVSDERYPDPQETAQDFNNDFLLQWKQTPNYALWQSLTTDSPLFDIVEPRHPTAGGLNIEDVQRRVGAAVSELHLDDRVRQGRETAEKALGAGRERVGAGVARFWKEVESFKDRRSESRNRENISTTREKSDMTEGSGVMVEHDDVFDAGRKSAEDTKQTGSTTSDPTIATTDPGSATASGGWAAALKSRAANVQRPNVDTVQVQQAARENAAKAGAYLSSWGSWARDKSKEWQEGRAREQQQQAHVTEKSGGTTVEAPTDGLQGQTSAAAVTAAKNAMGTSK